LTRGWRARPDDHLDHTLVVLLNLAPPDLEVDLELGIPGTWVTLADIDTVEDVPPAGTNSVDAATALRSRDGRFTPVVLSSSSWLIYRGLAPLWPTPPCGPDCPTVTRFVPGWAVFVVLPQVPSPAVRSRA
jgi:hypothetical protein